MRCSKARATHDEAPWIFIFRMLLSHTKDGGSPANVLRYSVGHPHDVCVYVPYLFVLPLPLVLPYSMGRPPFLSNPLRPRQKLRGGDQSFRLAAPLFFPQVLHSPVCAEAVKTGTVGIGQLFRSLDILPSFELLNAGHRTRVHSPTLEGKNCVGGNETDGHTAAGRGDIGLGGGQGERKGGLWRVYDLRSQHVSCRIHEEFVPGLFELFE